MAREGLGLVRGILLGGLGVRQLGLFFRQQPLNHLPLERIDLGRKQLLKMRDVQVRNGSIHGRL